MQSASNVISQSVRSIRSGRPIPEDQTSEKKLYQIEGEWLTLTELFWKRMAGLYGYTWTRQNGVDPTPEWELCLAAATPDTIKIGIGRMTKDSRFAAFPPTPMQFRVLCLPRGEDLGLPAFELAFDQATKSNTDKHPSVVYAIRQIGDSFGFRQMKTEQSKKVFLEAWSKTLAHVMAGGELPEKPVEVEEVHTKASLESVADTRQGLMGMFHE